MSFILYNVVSLKVVLLEAMRVGVIHLSVHLEFLESMKSFFIPFHFLALNYLAFDFFSVVEL